ncbi:hypothetical protein [Paenibacillus sp. FSL R10-2771]|uniref:hypothetical protein n=1 Tax=Paenibacillus sp. FSL R10-2771 TaxID=2954693 RepID=UPI0030FBB899
MNKSDSTLRIVERNEIRRKLRDLYSQQDNEIIVHSQASTRIDREIFRLKQKLAELDPKSMERKPNNLKPRTHSCKPVENCINPKCHKRIEHGQPAVKYGFWGLCCNFKCLSEAMGSSEFNA